MRVLFTAFDPFGGNEINPSMESVKLMANQVTSPLGNKISICKLFLPTKFGDCARLLEKKMQEGFDAVICIGLAGNRKSIDIERVAINIDDARIPDNAGVSPVDEPIVLGAPAAYFSSLPIKAIVRALQNEGISSGVSNSAGTYVCNHIMYSLLHSIAVRPELGSVRGGFIHVPDTINMPLKMVAQALEIAACTTMDYVTDIKVSGGKIS